MILLENSKITKLESRKNHTTKKWIYFTILINLAGIPPLAGFLAKWIIFTESIYLRIIRISLTLLIIRSVNLYIYMRMINPIATENSSETQINFKNSNFIRMNIVLSINLFPLMIIYI